VTETHNLRSTGRWSSTFITNASCLAIGVVTGVISARLLLPQGRGELATVLYWGSFIGAVGAWSLPDAVASRTAAGIGEERSVSAGLSIGAVFSVLSVVASLVLLPSLLSGPKASLRPLAAPFLIVFLPTYILTMILLGAEQGALRLGRYNVNRLLSAGLVLIGYVGIAAAKAFTVPNAVYVALASTLIPATTLLGTSRLLISVLPTRDDMKDIAHRASGFQLSALVGILAGQLDRLAVLHYCDMANVGLYAVAFTYASSGLNVVTTTFATVALPELGRAAAAGTEREYLQGRLAAAAMILYFTSGALSLIGRPLIPALFGKGFSAAWIVSSLLAFAYIPLALRQIIIRALRGIGLWRMGMVCEALAVLLFAAGLVCLRHITLTTIAIVLGISNMVTLLVVAGYLKRTMNIAPLGWLVPRVSTLKAAGDRVGELWAMFLRPIVREAAR
jgi:O-antigen/teichoic acid export membrane protein